MDNNVVLVENLEDKISKIVDRYHALKAQVGELTVSNEKLKEELQEAKSKYKQLEEEHNTLRISKTLELSQGDSNMTKLKINELVREIDKCIALLNK